MGSGEDPETIEKAMDILVSNNKEDYEAALESCRFRNCPVLTVFFNCGISDPRVIEAQGRLVGDESVVKRWVIGTTAGEHLERMNKYVEAGFNHLYFVSSSPDEPKFKFYG